MKIEIRYFSKTGNTKKLADAIAQELNNEAKELSAPLIEKVDILFLCNSVYWAGADSGVQFSAHCEVCYACLHNCPKSAIHMPLEAGTAHFRNEHITLNEIIESNQ